jgi:uncharacterized protein (DUF608 family)
MAMGSGSRKGASMPRRVFLKRSVAAAGAVGAMGAADARSVASQAEQPSHYDSGQQRGRESEPVRPRRYNDAYKGEALNRVAFPMGGMGAGMICLEGTGALSHFSLRNRPEVFNEPMVFAAICVKGGPNVARVLEGPVPGWKVFGAPGTGNGAAGKTYGLPRFREATFKPRFPFAAVRLKDKAVPLAVEITGWSPFEPGDADNASLPVAGLEYRFVNTGRTELKAVFSFNAKNFMAVGQGRPSVRPAPRGFVFREEGPKDRPWERGEFSARVTDPEAKVNLAWFRGGWWDPLTMAWKNVQDGACYERPAIARGGPSPGATLFVPFRLAPRRERTIVLQLSWFVGRTNLRIGADPKTTTAAATTCTGKCDCSPNYTPWYAGRFKGIDELAAYWSDKYDELRRNSERFSDCFYDTTLPAEVIEAVAANLTILKSPTVMRQADGRLWNWEGCGDNEGCCHGTCTHVWNYAQALPHLFPGLERTLRETEFQVSQDARGHQAFRSGLPIRPVVHDFHAAADGQLGGIMKVFREWRISGDTEWLRRLWPSVKQSMSYCIETWDPKRKGVVEEPHHNTYDIEFWGPDGMCTSFYLGALAGAVTMGKALGEDVSPYSELIEKGTRFAEDNLFNGEYFFQKIRWEGLQAKSPLEEKSFGGKYSPEAVELLKKEGPKYQYGTGCLSDGVLGSWMALVCGVGQVLDRQKVTEHLKAVHKYNLKKDLSEHANPQRPSYAVGSEGGLLLCTWPRGGKLSLPFVYSDEVWTGIEYQVASHLMLMGLVEEGLEIVRTCRDRYDGRVRNPFNEYECGHWYARAMSSYALLQGLTGARYDAVDKVLHIAPNIRGDFRGFIAAATGYGTVGVKDGKPFVEVRRGTIDAKRVQYTPRA